MVRFPSDFLRKFLFAGVAGTRIRCLFAGVNFCGVIRVFFRGVGVATVFFRGVGVATFFFGDFPKERFLQACWTDFHTGLFRIATAFLMLLRLPSADRAPGAAFTPLGLATTPALFCGNLALSSPPLDLFLLNPLRQPCS